MEKTKTITVQAVIDAPIETVWRLYTQPGHIKLWNRASDNWHTPKAENNLQVGGTFYSRMESKDGSVGFDFVGTYTSVIEHQRIEYVMSDGRNVSVLFEGLDTVRITITFDAESTNPLKFQRDGWQAILNNFKKYAEENE
jgi:uncharacterized protein YndB with AHSA1/START domain